MYLIYLIGSYIGFFAVMIICVLLAIIIARKFISWPVYVLGAGFTLLSLIGHTKAFGLVRGLMAYWPYWIIYILILGIGAMIISSKIESREYVQKHSKEENPEKPEDIAESVPTPEQKIQKKVSSQPKPTPVEETYWKCAHCGVENSSNYGQCKKCGTYRNN